ncbi:hypothetical protein [Bifidobacterium aemilianum]|nr:hypothetical protein [Bifidobacterium aemilianum]
MVVVSGPTDVSKHPEASIPESDLSLADIERERSKPLPAIIYGLLIFAAIIVPYWLGRALAIRRTKSIIVHLTPYAPQGIALVAWAVTVIMFTGLAVSLVESRRWLWRIIFVVALAAEQLIAGVALLKFDFWYSTYVVYGQASNLVNAANLGICAAGLAVAVFAVIFVGLLVLVRKDSPLNVLTRSWAAFIMFFVFELIALALILFGGIL